MKARYGVALCGLQSLLFASIDLYNFEYVLLPIWIFIECLGCGLILCMKAIRRFVRIGFACLGCSLIVLILGGVVGSDLNRRNQADAVKKVNEVERFRIETGHYPSSISEISSLGIPEKRVKFRARWVYSPKENDDYFFEIQTFPIGFVKWNRATKVWDDEIL